MYHTLCIVAATWLAVDPPQTLPQAPTYAPTSAPVVQQQAPVSTRRSSPPTLAERIRSWFGGGSTQQTQPQQTTRTTPSQSRSTVTPASYRRNEQTAPVSRTQQPQPQSQPGAAVPQNRMSHVLSAAELQKVGHDQDYTWITAKLVRAQGNRWMIVYAGPNEVDRYQGSMLLLPPANMTNVQDGDLVCVHGRVVGGQGGSLYYEAREVNPIDRPAR